MESDGEMVVGVVCLQGSRVGGGERDGRFDRLTNGIILKARGGVGLFGTGLLFFFHFVLGLKGS